MNNEKQETSINPILTLDLGAVEANHLSNNKGIARSDNKADLFKLTQTAKGLDLHYNNADGLFICSFTGISHFTSWVQTIALQYLNQKSTDNVKKLFAHISTGAASGKNYLSLTHGESIEQLDILAPYHALFDSLGISKVERNGKGSKLFKLYCTPTPELVQTLHDNDFDNVTPVLDGFTVVGLKCELPKVG